MEPSIDIESLKLIADQLKKHKLTDTNVVEKEESSQKKTVRKGRK